SRGRGGKGDAAASIDGKKIGSDAVGTVIQQRKLANAYMDTVTELSQQQAFSTVYRRRDDANPEVQKLITDYAQLEVLKRQLPPEYIVGGLSRLQQELPRVRVTLTLGGAANKESQTSLID